MSRAERPVRLIDAVAVFLWVLGVSLLLIDAVLIGGAPAWFSRWGTFTGIAALGATTTSLTTWAVGEITSRMDQAEVQNLVRLSVAREEQQG